MRLLTYQISSFYRYPNEFQTGGNFTLPNCKRIPEKPTQVRVNS